MGVMEEQFVGDIMEGWWETTDCGGAEKYTISPQKSNYSVLGNF